MGWRMAGIVTFEFSEVESETLDPKEAIHEVENMSIGELLEYADGYPTVTVDFQEVS